LPGGEPVKTEAVGYICHVASIGSLSWCLRSSGS
jgi:hypothetical protein